MHDTDSQLTSQPTEDATLWRARCAELAARAARLEAENTALRQRATRAAWSLRGLSSDYTVDYRSGSNALRVLELVYNDTARIATELTQG